MLSLALLLAVWLHSSAAGAAEPTPNSNRSYVLEWQAPESCPSGARVDHAISSMLAGSTKVEDPVHATVRITHGSAAWQLEMTLKSKAGQHRRSIEAEDCITLAQAAALVIAVAADPLADADPDKARQLLTQPELPGPSDEPQAEAPQPEPAADDIGPSPSEARFGLQLAVHAHQGILPKAGAGASAGAFLDVGHWRFGIRAQGGWPQTRRTAGLAGAKERYWFAGGELAGCWQPRWKGWWFPLCAVGEQSWLAGRLSDAPAARSDWVSFQAVGGRMGVLFGSGLWRWGPAVRAKWVVQPGRFFVDPVGEVHEVGPWLFRLGIQFELSLSGRFSEP